MKLTLLFTLLITNTVSASIAETATFFIWDPYSTTGMTRVSPPKPSTSLNSIADPLPTHPKTTSELSPLHEVAASASAEPPISPATHKSDRKRVSSPKPSTSSNSIADPLPAPPKTTSELSPLHGSAASASAEPLRLPPTHPTPVEYFTSPQALTVSKESFASTSDSMIKDILTEIEALSNRKINSSKSQQYCINRLRERLNEINHSSHPKSANHSGLIFESLQFFLNREYVRLRKGLTTTLEQCLELRQQYESILTFCDAITTFSCFSTAQIEKLHCFHVTFLIGTANVCGFMQDNTTKKDYATQALVIVNTSPYCINDPYGIGMDFIDAVMRRICNNLINTAQKYIDRASASQESLGTSM